MEHLECLDELLEEEQMAVLLVDLEELSQVLVLLGALADAEADELLEELVLMNEEDLLLSLLGLHVYLVEDVSEEVLDDLRVEGPHLVLVELALDLVDDCELLALLLHVFGQAV